ncbi:uncharacterized protein UPF0158 [Breznakibacter xylanolyticus]|uniref:Uncharacterized protein UPF0158 n=1 Tax=Breznakibacter xylanolyticus TaxID=990 RepID=A0A2W7NK94_9BACT|nr:UPF0158 family protein [Breznakibacter xylanolyticus]PZX20698.1 uncharacterized protein UPF0158 [Breznakibacter xylanolyticus]
MILSDSTIYEIAENLDAGMRCFVHQKTNDIKIIPDSLNPQWFDIDNDIWKEDCDEIENNRTDYLEIKPFDSHEAFKIMADFSEIIDNKKLQNRLIRALNQQKPFKHFKDEINDTDDYRQQWFEYKKNRLIEFIYKQLANHSAFENNDKNC